MIRLGIGNRIVLFIITIGAIFVGVYLAGIGDCCRLP